MSQEGSFSCQYCPNVYKKFFTLKTHIFKHHVSSMDKKDSLDTDKSVPKKKTCKPGRPRNHKCKNCNIVFTTVYSLARHVDNKICTKEPKRKDETQEKHKIQEDKSFTPAVLQALADVLLLAINKNNTSPSNSGMINSNNNNMTVNNDNHTENNTQNTQNNNILIKKIHINPIGSENLSHLTQDTIISILNQGTNAVPALAKAIMDVPENRNIVITDKRNKKATVVNRSGEIEIMELKKAISMCATDNIDRVDSYYESYKDQLPANNKSIQRMAKAHGLDDVSSDESSDSDEEERNKLFDTYTDKIQNLLEVNKKPALVHLNKYRDHIANKPILSLITS